MRRIEGLLSAFLFAVVAVGTVSLGAQERPDGEAKPEHPPEARSAPRPPESRPQEVRPPEHQAPPAQTPHPQQAKPQQHEVQPAPAHPPQARATQQQEERRSRPVQQPEPRPEPQNGAVQHSPQPAPPAHETQVKPQQHPSEARPPERAEQPRPAPQPRPVQPAAREQGRPHPPSPEERRVEQTAWQPRRAEHWQREHRDWHERGGYRGYRIPQERYVAYFGPQHVFPIYTVPIVVVGGYPRFQYEGFWFTVVDPWPEYWAADWYYTDDVYVAYVGDGYYLRNPRYPGVQLAINVTLG